MKGPTQTKSLLQTQRSTGWPEFQFGSHLGPESVTLFLADCLSAPCKGYVPFTCLPQLFPPLSSLPCSCPGPGTRQSYCWMKSHRKAGWGQTQTKGLEPWDRDLGLGCLMPDTLHSYLNWLFHTLVKEVERASPLHPEGRGGPRFVHGETVKGHQEGSWQGGQNKADLAVFPERNGKSLGSPQDTIRDRNSPRIRGLLWATPLQLPHQHLTATSQGIPELPKGATAPQRAAAILWGSTGSRSSFLCSLTSFLSPILTPLHSAAGPDSSRSDSDRGPAPPDTSRLPRRSPRPPLPSFSSSTTLVWLAGSRP